jgi:hypothetical protein
MSFIREPNAEPIAGYRLIEPLGSGGFGEVWKCEAPGGLVKAIKFVYGNLNSLDVDAVRAEQEMHALQRIKEVRHPFVCSLDRIEVVGGELVIVMELAEKTLHDLFIECQGAGLIGIPRDDLLRYLRDTAEALDHMNEKHKLQHLDVKPRNLFLIGDRVKVADFGLVKHLERLSSSGLLGGVTPLYAAPETFNGKISDRSDQYSLAIVYQELLTGHRPYVGKNVRQMAQAHLQGEPDLRALPEADRPVIGRALAKDPAKRFPSCLAFVRALYNARHPTPSPQQAEAVLAAAGHRPKSMSDTLDDIMLDAVGEPPDDGLPPRPPPADGEAGLEVSQLGVTIVQPQTGSLRPTLVLGVGGFGRKALLELRCRFLDRFGDLSKIPLLRFLCLETDPEAVSTAVRGAPDVALSRNEVYPLPLQPVGNYRRRSLDQLTEWLPREKLYAMPRSLQTQGSRALGRLAFVDNQQRLLARLRREVQEVTNPDALYQSVSQTGLALRDSTPRVYVLASAGGGGSGMLADLGYALRRLLAQMRHPDAELTLHLCCGAPGDPATPKAELANVYATLTELNHFSDLTIPFVAQYGADGQRIVDNGTAFGSVYLLPLAHRSPQALDEAVAHLGSYLFHEVTTPLGLRLDQIRRDAAGEDGALGRAGVAASFRSFGTYAVWFPRGLLLRLAARLACRKTIEGWLACQEGPRGAPPAVPLPVAQACERLMADPGLRPEALVRRIEEASRGLLLTDLASSPAEALTGLLATLEEQSGHMVAQEEPVSWGRQASNRVRDWVGTAEPGDDLHDWRKSRLTRTLTAAAQKAAEEWNARAVPAVFGVMEQPGERVAAAEAALTYLQQLSIAAAEDQDRQLQQQQAQTAETWRLVQAALAECQGGGAGFRLFGGRSTRRLLRSFMEALSHYARQRLAEEMTAAVRHFFMALRGRLEERRRDLGFCRQRLRHLMEALEGLTGVEDDPLALTRPGLDSTTMSHSPAPSAESFWEAIRESATARVVLPDNEQDLERAAVRFLQSLAPEHWLQFDKDLHERVLTPRGGLHSACMSAGDVVRTLAVPLLDEAVSLLGQHLPIMDVAQILGAEFGILDEGGQEANGTASPELEAQSRSYLGRTTPLLARLDGAGQSTFLLVPASRAGKALAEATQRVLPDLNEVKVPGQADLMFCRDQGLLGTQDLERVFRLCRQAYEAVANNPQSSAHARYDITDWLPLDP